MLLKKLIISLVIAVSATFATANTAVQRDQYLESVNLNQYIASNPHPKVKLSNDFGQLLSESMITSYTSDVLHKSYRGAICKSLYWFNCNYNIKNIQQYAGIDLNSESGLIGQQFSQINAYKVTYNTPGMNGLPHRVSGGVLIPQSEQPLKGIIVFYHYTVLNKDNVPSNFEQDEFHLSKNIAATLASDGYVVLMPDYLGLGDDKAFVHPYILYPLENALSGLYMLKLLPQIQPSLRYQLNDKQIPLFLSGYSEGAAYSLWAAKIIQDNPQFLTKAGFKLSRTIPIDGAYNLSKVTLPFVLDNVNKAKSEPYFVSNPRVTAFGRPGLIANMLNSYATFNPTESNVFNTQFAACHGCVFDGKTYDLNTLLQSSAKEIDKYKFLYTAAKKTGYSNENDSIRNLINPMLLNSSKFKEQAAAADIYNWKANTPVSFLSYEYDSVVPRLNSETAYAAMAAQGSSSLSITIIPNQNFKVDSPIPLVDMRVDHPQGLNFMLLFVRKQLDESTPTVQGTH
jgi:hypothetical protein